jgi:ABC-type phosphate transport system permease subunit
VDTHTSYLVDVILPTIVFGLGLATMVAPLTATVLAAVPDHRAGIASGVNNAVARTGGLLAIAMLPIVTHIGADGFDDPSTLRPAFVIAMWICAGLLAAGGLLSAVFVRRP